MTESTTKSRLFAEDGEDDILNNKYASVVREVIPSSSASFESLPLQECGNGEQITKRKSVDRLRIDASMDDPLTNAKDIDLKFEESLTIRTEDESRIVGVS